MRSKSVMPKTRLTPRQQELLKAIHCFQASRCYSPTIAELASKACISRSTVFEHITELRKKGLLSASPGRARSLKITSKAQELLDTLDTQLGKTDPYQTSGIPLVGKVAAGTPIEAIEDVDCISLNTQFGTGDDIFALKVTGDSMIEDDIQDGDYIVCRRSNTARDGQIVVAIVDDENATVKRFYKEKNRVRLQPANANYQPIYCDNCRIEAIVVGLVRNF